MTTPRYGRNGRDLEGSRQASDRFDSSSLRRCHPPGRSGERTDSSLRSVRGVKLPFVPGPSDVIAAVEGLRDGVAEALALVPRVATAVGRMENLLDQASGILQRADGLVGRMDSTLEAADAAVRAVDRTRSMADEAIAGVTATNAKADQAIEGVTATNAKADQAIEGVTATNAKADEAIAAVGLTLTRADDTLTATEGLFGRLSPLMDDYEQPLRDLAPSVRRLSETFDPGEVEALVTLIDRLPALVKHLDEDILPVLETLGNVGTDVHDLVDTVQDLRQIVKGFPGSRLFRRRGAEEIAQEEREEAVEGA